MQRYLRFVAILAEHIYGGTKCQQTFGWVFSQD